MIEAPEEIPHFHHEEPISCCRACSLFIFFVFISLETLLLGVFLKLGMLIYMGIGFFVFFSVLVCCVNQKLKKHVIDIDVPKNEMVIEHCRMPIYCCWKKEKFTITPLTDIITFSYPQSFSLNEPSIFSISSRFGANYKSEFTIPNEKLRRIEAILKLLNPALINNEVSEHTTINRTNYPTYSANPYLNVPASTAVPSTAAVATPASLSPSPALTAAQLGLIINQLQGQQLALQQQEEQRGRPGLGSNVAVPVEYPLPPADVWSNAPVVPGEYQLPPSFPLLPVGIGPGYQSSPSSVLTAGVHYPTPSPGLPLQYQNTKTSVGMIGVGQGIGTGTGAELDDGTWAMVWK